MDMQTIIMQFGIVQELLHMGLKMVFLMEQQKMEI